MTRKRSTKRRTTSRRTSSSRGRRTSSSRARSSRPSINISLNLHQKFIIIGIFLIFLTALIILSLLSPNQGQLTSGLSNGMWQLFGWGGVIIPIALGLAGFYLVLWGMEQPPQLPHIRLVGILLLFLSFEAFASLAVATWNDSFNDVVDVAQAGEGGGYLGAGMAWLLTAGFGQIGAIFLLLVIGIVAAILTSGIGRRDMGLLLTNLFSRTEKEEGKREIPITSSRSRPGTSSVSPSNSRPVEATAEPASASATGEVESQPVPAPTIQNRRRGRRRRTASQPQPAANGGQEVPPTPVFFNQSDNQVWTLPRLEEMLEPGGEQDVGDATIREQVEVIEHTLESFGAPASVVEISQGPTITQYGVEPSFIVQRSGKRTKVKVGKIASLADDLALALAAKSIRIQAPVPGKGYVGIEVPNPEKALVSLRDVMESSDFQTIQSPLRIGLGQNVAGQAIATDLTQMPHLLIAGTTGSGKSVCVNSIIACLVLQNSPDMVKLVMVDPKRVELTAYNGIPHLVAPVIVDLDRVVGTLQWAMREMDNRYKQLADVGARNIVEFNKKAAKNSTDQMPYIVIIIDELADLMMLSPEETERGITRLAQMARATGIHMVIATQRPSVDVVTGLIKANFPARVAFAVASSTDSRVILDTTGAERLLGQGDMLFQSPDAAAPIRMQGCFVSETELHKIIDYWQGARRLAVQSSAAEAEGDEENGEATEAVAEPSQPPLWEEMREAEKEAEKYSDELLPEAIEMVRQMDKASTSLLQRRFRIGYTRAARLMDIMEEEGIIGPPTGTSKARKVLPFEKEEFDPVAGGDSQE